MVVEFLTMEVALADMLYSTSDLAELLRVSRQTINTWIDERAFPRTQKVGRSYAIPAGDVASFLESKIDEAREEVSRLEDLLKEVSKGVSV